MRKVLITGSTGFIGTALTQRLLDLDYKVYITAGIHPENKPLVNGRQHLNVPFQELDWDKLPNLNAVFHLASCTDTLVRDDAYMLQVNHLDALDLINKAAEHGVPNIVYASSAAVYGRYHEGNAGEVLPFTEDMPLLPLNIYGESKAKLDKDCRKLMERFPETSIVGLRYSNVYGGKLETHKVRTASMVWQLYQKMQHESPTLFKWGKQARDFVHVNDIVDANLLAATAEQSGIYNIGAGKMWSFNAIVDIVNKVLGTNRTVKYIDNPIEQYYQDYNLVNVNLARTKLGYTPKIMLEQGIEMIHSNAIDAADGRTPQLHLGQTDDGKHGEYQTEVHVENA